MKIINLEITEVAFCVKSVGVINNSIFAGIFIRNVHLLIHSLTKKGFLNFSLAKSFASGFQKNESNPCQLASEDTLGSTDVRLHLRAISSVSNGACTNCSPF